MYTFSKIFGCLAVVSFTLASPPDKRLQNENLKIIILHNNDMHARFEQTNAFSSRCSENDERDNKCYGGFARVAHLVREYRKKANLGEISQVLYLNAGDTYTGTPWFSLFKDNITATFLDLLKPDAISLGNHEFDEGTENLGKFLSEINFPVLAANIIIDKEPQLKVKNLKSSHVFTIDERKIGVIGYLTPETKEVASPNKVEFIDEIEAINKEAEKLQSQGVDIILALGHSGIERDKQIAHSCPHIDLVIGGHSHTFLYDGNPPDIEKPYDVYPVTVIQRDGKKVPVVQSYAYTKYLGYLHLEFDKNGNLIEIDGTPILLNGAIDRETDVLEMLEVYRPAVLELQNEVVGSSRVQLDGLCRRQECNLGNFVADSMVDWNAKKYSGKGWTDAAIGIIQGGGVRASIEKTDKGITMEDLQTVLPFESKVVVIEISGDKLLEALEHSVHRYTDLEERGEFLQYSGLHVEYDMNKPSGKRVTNVKILCAYCEIPELESFELTKKYRIVVQDFLASGGDGYSMFKNSQIQESETLDVDVLKQYIKKTSPVYPAIEWRIIIKEFIDPSEEILGYTKVNLDSSCYRTECNLGNFITDAMTDWYSLNYEPNIGWSAASIALIPANNIKHSIDSKINNGAVTRKDAMSILPSNNEIAVANVTGKVLQEVLEYAVHRFEQNLQPSEFLQMSGIHVEYDLSRNVGSRVISVKVLCSSCNIPQLENMEENKFYNVLIPANIANGSLGYVIFKNYTKVFLEATELDVFINYLKRKNPIYPSVEWRISLLNLNPAQDNVGSTRVLLNNDCTLKECNLGNFITDSMVDWYASQYNGKGWTDSSIAIIQGNLIKSSISPNQNQGIIFKSDVEKVFDPPYNLLTITLDGNDLMNLLEYSVSTYDEPNYLNFLQTSGMQLVYDIRKPSGHRLTDIKVLCTFCDIPELKPINKTEYYKIIVQSTLISDGFFEVPSGSEIKDLEESDINVFLKFLKKKSPVYPAVEWRITIIEEDKVEETTLSISTTTLGVSNLNYSFPLVLMSILVSFLMKK